MRISILILCALFWINASAQKNASQPAKDIVRTLERMQKGQEVTPDSFFDHVEQLREAIRSERDSLRQAVYSATLAHSLAVNSYRATFGRGKSAAHPDSIREWGRQDYLHQAAILYASALRNPELLRRSDALQWVPLVQKPRQSCVQKTDLLNFLWQAAVDDLPHQMFAEHALPTYQSLIAVRLAAGEDDEALFLVLDSLDRKGFSAQDSVALQQLARDYARCDAAAEVHLRLSQLPDYTPQRRKAILEQALKQYPHYHRRAALQNALLQLSAPELTWRVSPTYYPAQPVHTVLNARNLTTATVTLYRLPNAFDTTQPQLLSKVMKAGKAVKTLTHRFPAHAENFVQITDTLHWTAPAFGHYAMVVRAQTPAKLCAANTPQIAFFRVSALASFAVSFPNGVKRHVVVNAATGKPMPDVDVTYQEWKDGKMHLYKQTKTDARGITEFEIGPLQRRNMSMRLKKGADDALEAIDVNTFHFTQYDNTEAHNQFTLVYTDRGVYRPGQKVYTALIAYDKQGRRAEVRGSDDVVLTYFDHNQQELARHTVRTDAFGMAQDSIELPAYVLPGTFRVVAKGASACSFRVEEYKRPTFFVRFDDPGAAVWPLDSVTVSGRVQTYSGAPLGGVRVSGNYQWKTNFWRMHFPGSAAAPAAIDTVLTDSEGKFAVRVPLERDTEAYRRGRRLALHVDALSTYGETQQADFALPLCSTPLRLFAGIARWQDKDRLKAWNFTLTGPTDLPVQADVTCTLRKADGQVAFTTVLPAGTDTVPAGLRDVPSGAYTLHAMVRVQADTASCSTPVNLFSVADDVPPADTALWVYCARDTFSAGQPAALHIGSSLDTAYVYFTLITPAGTAMDTLMRFNGNARLVSIPYRDEYADGARLNIAMYSAGKFFSSAHTLRHAAPSRKLTLRWQTFRDLLQPGQHEEWKLRVTYPDGTPADANFMCTLYDASLDAIAQHRMSLDIHDGYRIPSLAAFAQNNFMQYHAVPFCLRLQDEPQLRVPSWTYRYFAAPRAVAEDMVYTTEEVSDANVARRPMKQAAAGAALSRTMASKSVAEVEVMDEAPGAAAESGAAQQLRTGLGELAFFRPMLRTDERGEVCISFTLPQGLTSWHLKGLAHTRDMHYAAIEDTIVARKDFMAEVHVPRYFREGDSATVTATLRNLSTRVQSGKATLTVMDAASERVLHTAAVNGFTLQPGADATHRFPIRVPKDCPLLLVRWQAETPEAADGEQRALPVLSDTELITETKTFHIDAPGKWQTDLKKLFGFDSPDAAARSLTVEYSARPVWLALQALPSLAENGRTDALSTAAACYATTLTRHISLQMPALRDQAKAWSETETPAAPGANAALVQLLRDEMPWMDEERNADARRQRMADLMLRAHSPSHLMALTRQISALQQQDGTFAWYPGMPGNTYITTRVLLLLARLQQTVGNADLPELHDFRSQIIARGLKPLHRSLLRQEEHGEPATESVLDFLYILHHMGGRQPEDMLRDARRWTAFLAGKADKMVRAERARAALVLCDAGEEKQARGLMQEVLRVVKQPDGYYLAYPGGTRLSEDAKIQCHVDVMEAFARLMPQDTVAMKGLQLWLLQQKRTEDWTQPVATANAVNALVKTCATTLTDASTDRLTLVDADGRHTIDSPESALGYIRVRVPAVKPKQLKVEKKSKGLSWGAVYAQYTMPVAKVEAQREGLTVRRETPADALTVGRRTTVRYVLTVDRDLDFVCLTAPRMAAAEPAVQTSGYVSFGRVGAYRAVHDARTDYFFDRLPRGTYVVEEDWLVTAPGDYQLGAASLRCVYDAAFQSHTAGAVLHVGEK